MNLVRYLALAVVGVASVGVGLDAKADYHTRQYYANWKSASYSRGTPKYYYRQYYYKPSPTYVGYKHHYAMYYPAKPQHVYFYNPYSKTYWGRCPLHTDGQPAYSMLEEKDRKGNIEDIPETAFPEPAKKLPPIPEATDGETLDLPPDDLPGEDTKLPK